MSDLQWYHLNLFPDNNEVVITVKQKIECQKTRGYSVQCTLRASVHSHSFLALSQKLKTGYHSENQFWNPGFTNGFTQFCGYRYFCYEILFYLVSSYFTIFSNLLNKNLHKF